MADTMYVVTRAINQYDQDGHYFVSAFTEKPTVEQLVELLQCSTSYAKWLHDTGGGRQDIEYEWYYLREQEVGKPYIHTY